ncbi:RidA family protein [Niveibacterium umoris]|uniref:Enamine deaminase RidA (YjgF/YER057c/UK114 family) n=1 Tax=Niveibacterium umoris TaxID=1193620 RepID=A0A840BRC4_9RHOO|nr:RidA family protein [Niveibacterium umoris]MBB4014009.1 enamine deaminase RidA (YjgF/YER057c/UK114 family) [Niveibacterium umoris]
MDIQRIGLTPRYADAVVHNGVVHAVEVPPSEEGDITRQSSALLEVLAATLERAGSGKHRLLTATIYLIDMADYDGFNAVWDAWLAPGCAPSRACVKVAGLARAGWRVEVVVSAAVG